MVEWKKLKEFCSDIIVPMRDRPKVFNGIIPWCRIEDIEGMYFNKSLSGLKVSEEIIRNMNLKVFPTGTVICSCSATLGVCAINTQPLITNQTFIGLVCSDDINNRFLYYYMLTRKRELESLSTTGTIPYISRAKFENLKIPFLPLSEQNRIVGILDTFTESIENLKKQIAQRHKQFEYYRDQLLDLEGKPGVEMKKITDVATNYTGLTYKPNNVTNSGTLVLRSSNIGDFKLTFKDNVFVQMDNIPKRAIAKEGDILICVRNGSKRLVGKSAMITKEADGMAFGAFMTVLRTNSVNSKYLFYLWQSKKVKAQYKGDEAMPIAQITSKDFRRILIPIVSPAEQIHIVSILDSFEASIANLEQQLAQRQKQYEYYRNKLLTFE